MTMTGTRVPALLVGIGAVLIALSIALKDGVFAALALVAFGVLLLVLIARTLPSMRYKQSVKYDHSFLTNLLGGTSDPVEQGQQPACRPSTGRDVTRPSGRR
jgi:hypothetical protein